MKFISRKNDVINAKDEALQRALTMIGMQMEGYAKEEITRKKAVDTGRLRNSITYATATSHDSGELPAVSADYSTHGTPEKDTVYVGTNVEYAP